VRLLVLGGTGWLGGEVAGLAHAAGHDVTCLARGVSGSVPDGVRLVVADRNGADAYTGLCGDFDAAVEVSWQPEHVHRALEALAGRVAHWVYVSSISAYTEDASATGDEDDPLLPPLPRPWGMAAPESYGSAKVTCEVLLAEHVGVDRLLVARAGLIAGYGDPSDRFGYWPGRMAQSARRRDVLVPPRRTPVQVVDVVDLASWLVLAAERRSQGAFDAVGPRTDLGTVLAVCAELCSAGGRPILHEVDEALLHDQGVAPWAGPDSLPLWLPAAAWSVMSRSGDRAREAGLRSRSMHDTVRASHRWEAERGLLRRREAGLTPEREAAVLRAAAGPGEVVDSS
jgi:2'-hydroxyisoflavone reductase